MIYRFLYIIIIIFLGWSGLHAMPAGERQASLGNVYALPQEEHIVKVRQAVPVHGLYLAVLEITPRSVEERKSLIQQYGSYRHYAPAWIDPKDWKIVRVGRGEYAHPSLLNPPPNDVADPTSAPSFVFPQVIVRNPSAGRCPFLWGTTTRVVCLEETLEFGQEYVPPVLTRGYLVVGDQVWFKGHYDGRLLHRIDWGGKGILDSKVDTQTLVEALAKAGFDKGDLQYLREAPRPLQREWADALKSGKTKDIPGWHYQLKWRGTPTSFQFDAVVQGDRAFVLLRRPLALVTLRWPEGTVERVTPIRGEDLPAWVHGYHEVYIMQMVPWRGNLLASFWLDRGLTYQEVMTTDPESARRIREFWQKHRPDEELTPDTVVTREMAPIAIEMNPDGVRGVVSFPLYSDLREWAPSEIFFLLNDEMWVTVKTRGKPENEASYGIAQIHWD